MNTVGRRCIRCRKPIAADNPGGHCSACRPAVMQRLQGPGPTTASFWRHGDIQVAVAERHMGRIIAAYRRHPDHGVPISQEMIGRWAGMSQAQISRYETGGPDKQLDRLQFWARLLDIPPGMLWFSMPHGYQVPAAEMAAAIVTGEEEPDLDVDSPVVRGGRPPTYPAGVSAQQVQPLRPNSAVLGALTSVRVQLDEVLAASSVSPRQMELIEASTRGHVRDYPATPPSVMIERIAAECTEVTALSRRRQPAAVQARLSSCAALLATLSADALMRLGETPDARLWYRTAMLAADDSERPSLGVLVRAQAAMLPYYFGDPHETVELTDEALAMSAKPCRSTALAAASRARALARIGDTAAARDAVNNARTLFDEVGGDSSDAAFCFTDKRFLFYLSGAATWMADTRTGYRLQDEALELYSTSTTWSIDPCLILLDRARCLILDGRVGEAASVALEAVAGLPAPQRTEIVLARAHEIVTAVPAVDRPRPIVELDGYLRECRRQARSLAGGRSAING
ncbi:helix-turn-helix domain-containing protein [Actinoplanes sp. NPDC048988]|uniref:helix-turn-helix domain-containing protein n=1 Tax=Actinoplanes sp. NPDC048988 TaxID=3363901 RepID=UPI0037218534